LICLRVGFAIRRRRQGWRLFLLTRPEALSIAARHELEAYLSLS
jgi:hypothetical protein